MPGRPLRFLTVPRLPPRRATCEAQINARVERGELLAIKLGGQGQWLAMAPRPMRTTGERTSGDLDRVGQDRPSGTMAPGRTTTRRVSSQVMRMRSERT